MSQRLLTELHRVFDTQGEISDEACRNIAGNLGLTQAHVAGVASFYSLFTDGPVSPILYEIGVATTQETRILLPDTPTGEAESFDAYVSRGGYEGLKKALSAPDQVISTVSDARLRGRSGAYFPVGLKWDLVKKSPSDRKYVVCNACEAEPGTGKDYVLLCSTPHAVIEGMEIAACAVGATRCVLYIREGYDKAFKAMSTAIDEARKNGSLPTEIEVITGAGAYVTGEETGLLDSIEGRRGEPRIKPPFPVEKGLWQVPTIINNVETFANVPLIIRQGSSSFRKIGTEKCPGTKLFTLSGCVKKPGVYEFATGLPLRKIYEAAGGCLEGRQLKGVQIGGGGSGAIVGIDALDIAMDPDSCEAAGLTLGTGSLLFFDDRVSVVEMCRDCAAFYLEESCGKCTPCREGNRRVWDTLTGLLNGSAGPDSLKQLAQMADYISESTLCSLGQMSMTATKSAMKNFREEFERCIGGLQ